MQQQQLLNNINKRLKGEGEMTEIGQVENKDVGGHIIRLGVEMGEE